MKKVYNIQDNSNTHRLIKEAGRLYGIYFGLLFGLIVWGIDGWLLAQNNAALPWVKLIIGLPLSLLIFSLTGWLGTVIKSLYLNMLAWAIASGIMTYFSGHIPFEGISLLIRFLDKDLAGIIMIPFTYAAQVRTTMTIIINIFFGAGAGFLQVYATDWAWDFSSGGKLTLPSHLLLLTGLPFILFQGMFINGLIHQPMRTPQVSVNKLLVHTLSGEIASNPNEKAGFRSIKPYLDSLTPNYQTYFAGFSTTTNSWFTGYVDIHFDNRLILRCVTFNKRVAYCQDFSQQLETWMSQVTQYPTSGEKAWETAQVRHLDVTTEVLTWLTTQQPKLNGQPQVTFQKQYADWIFVNGIFEDGFQIRCRFHHVEPVLLDLCQ
ncbi:MAG: hypothetical protein J7L73_02030 [Anaerolineales bacterium]|nr:hypothetical protein [Anaerolineales bacterium]